MYAASLAFVSMIHHNAKDREQCLYYMFSCTIFVTSVSNQFIMALHLLHYDLFYIIFHVHLALTEARKGSAAAGPGAPTTPSEMSQDVEHGK